MRRSFLGRIALAIVVPPALFAGVEGLLRLSGRPAVMHPDRELLYVLDTEGAWSRRRASINSQGYRCGEIETPRRRDRLRILAVGGSTTFGHDLADDETWPYLLERRLHEAGFEAEVINGGVPGWGAEQCRIRLQRDLGWIEPDLVLLYTGWNWPRVDLQRSFNPFPYHAGLIDWLPLWMLETRTVLKLAKLANKMGGRPSRVAAQEAPRIQDDRYREGLVQELDQIGLQLRELGVPAFVVKFPAVIAPQPAADEQAELRTVEALLRHRWPRPADSTAQIAVEVREKLAQARTALEQDRGVQVLDVARVFDRLTPEQRAPLFLDRAHLTKAGNERLATALFEALRGAVENWEKLLRR